MRVKIFFHRSEKPIGWMIRAFGKMKTGEAVINHVGIILGDLITVEALPQGLRSQRFSEAYKGKKVIVYDMKVSPEVMDNIAAEATGQLGSWKSMYGFTKFPFLMADATTSWVKRLFNKDAKPVFFFSKFCTSKYFPVCSYFVAWLLYKIAKMIFFKQWRGSSPDDILDVFKKHPETFRIDPTLTTYYPEES